MPVRPEMSVMVIAVAFGFPVMMARALRPERSGEEREAEQRESGCGASHRFQIRSGSAGG
jgi:hypothetical protein